MALTTRKAHIAPSPPPPVEEGPESRLPQLLEAWENVAADLAKYSAAFSQYLAHFAAHDEGFKKLNDALPDLQALEASAKEAVVAECRNTQGSFATAGASAKYFPAKPLVKVDVDLLRQMKPELIEFPGLIATRVEVDVELFDTLVKVGQISAEEAKKIRSEEIPEKGGRVLTKIFAKKNS